MRRRVRLVAVLAVAGAALAGAMTNAGAREPSLGDVRTATARFHSITQAHRAGYEPFADCFDSPDGGMGQHYVNSALLEDGGAVDPLRPEALVYEVDSGRLRLVGVEYIVMQSDVDGPPRLFGQDFHPFGPFYVLHAWTWRDNPLGAFRDWNPDVTACP